MYLPSVTRAAAPQTVETFLNRHFCEVAFTVSTLTLALFSFSQLLFGSVLGIGLHYTFDVKIGATDSIIHSVNSTLVVVGAVATLIRLTPAGSSGGYLFQSLPFLASLAVGGVIYSTLKKCGC